MNNRILCKITHVKKKLDLSESQKGSVLEYLRESREPIYCGMMRGN